MLEKSGSTKIGIWTSTSLVIGNMIGSGVFLLPASLAFYGGISLLGWLGSSLGALILAALFSNLSKMRPNSQGGPYAYSKSALGDFAGFLVAWGLLDFNFIYKCCNYCYFCKLFKCFFFQLYLLIMVYQLLQV